MKECFPPVFLPPPNSLLCEPLSDLPRRTMARKEMARETGQQRMILLTEATISQVENKNVMP